MAILSLISCSESGAQLARQAIPPAGLPGRSLRVFVPTRLPLRAARLDLIPNGGANHPRPIVDVIVGFV